MSGVTALVGAFARRRARVSGFPLSFVRVAWRPTAGILVGVALIVGLRASGAISGSNVALEEMGFDPDRARLITGLTVGGLGAALGALLTGRRVAPILVAYAALGAVFGQTFVAETTAAAATPGPDGFVPLGWLATAVTLAGVTLAIGWALATLAIEVRRWLFAGWALLADFRRDRTVGRRQAVRIVAPLVALVVVLGSVPTLADMVNYTPDVAMTKGGLQQAPPLVGGSSSSVGQGASGGAPGGPSGSSAPGALAGSGGSARTGVPGGSGSSPGTVGPGGAGAAPGSAALGIVSAGAIASTQPWLASRPSGQGQVVSFTLPSPWRGSSQTTSPVWIYLPPGYASGVQRYPVIYTVPWDLTHWTMGIHVTALLDQAITAGTLPPSIVAFVDLAGGPFPNSECANSYDGREWTDTYVASTVVRYVDSHYRTIADPRARTIAGYSQGGFCAANLLLRHPDVFRQAVIFAGYFEAGLSSGETVNAWMPFGHVASVIAANSPMETADTLPSTVRSQLFVVLSAQPGLGVFGAQASQFATVLSRAGYPTDFLWNQLGHAWKAVRQEFIPALLAVAEREVRTGVLG